ncbi:MAG: hypothetical protein QF473_36655, partial [Planctomycetota bacterium]|nr:hypothetical protein [Planctomycetota bacterium]
MDRTPTLAALYLASILQSTLLAEPNDLTPTPPQTDHLHNRVIYVPYGELKRVFGDKHKGILLTYDRYQELWKLADLRSPKKPEKPPPIGATVTAAEYQGKVSDDVASFNATITMRSLAKTPTLCPLDFQGVGLASVSMDGQGASLYASRKGLQLVAEGPGEKTLTASFSVRVRKANGRRSLLFALPHSPASSIVLDLQGEASVEVASVPHSIDPDGPAGITRLQLAAGGRREISLTWKIKEARSKKEPVILVDSLLKLAIRPGTVRLDASANVSVLRTPVSEIQFSLPKEFDLVDYEIPQLRDIETAAAAETKTIRLTFHKPVTDKVKIRFAAEAGHDGADGGNVIFPQVSFLNALNQKGQAEIHVHHSLFARIVTVEQVRRVFEDPSKLSAQTEQARRAWRTYAIWRPDYRIVVDAKPVPLDTYAKVLSAYEVREQQMFLT